MKAPVAAILFALITIIYLQECNGELSDEMRIRMSLVMIVYGSERIQTGAYSVVCKKIFTLNTQAIKQYTDVIRGAPRSSSHADEEGFYDLKVYNALGETKHVSYRINNELKIITLMMRDDFTGFPLDTKPEPLPIGEEAIDDVAQLAGWKMDGDYIIIPVIIKKDNNSKFVHVLLEPFEAVRQNINGLYEMKQGDLLIQSNTIIGFLQRIDSDGRKIIFHRAAYRRQ